MRYLVVDGNLSGTGIRDSVEGGWLRPSAIGVSEPLSGQIGAWQQRYELAHFQSFSDLQDVAALDAEGLVLCERIIAELVDVKAQYFSSAKMRLLLL